MPPIAAWENHLRAEGSAPWEYRTVPWGLFHYSVSRLATIAGRERRENGTRYPTVSYPIPVFRYLPG